jgi:hypothetical protein
MERTYDIFEKMPDGTILWRDSVQGHEKAVSKLKEVAAGSLHEFQLLHLPTQSLVATVNTKPALSNS